MELRAVATLQLDCANITTTGAGTEINLTKYFVNPGKREMKAVLGVLYSGASTDSGTFDYKLQESNTTVDSDFSDISGATFTQIGDSDTTSIESIPFYTNKQYVRGYRTIGAGGATYHAVAALFAYKRDA